VSSSFLCCTGTIFPSRFSEFFLKFNPGLLETEVGVSSYISPFGAVIINCSPVSLLVVVGKAPSMRPA